MDNYRMLDDGAAGAFEEAYQEDEPAIERPPEIGVDERRMHVRAYNYWVSLLRGNAYPAIGDVDPNSLDDFGPHSVLLDFTHSQDDPEIAYVGAALREECALGAGVTRISQVPPRSLLSRLTDHYLQIIANCAPIGFEAEFVSQRGLNTMYRGILMPLSSDGATIDFIYGVINWKEFADSATCQALIAEVDRSVAAAPASPAPNPIWADGPHAERTANKLAGLSSEEADTPPEFAFPLSADVGLADRLFIARETAEAARGAEGRSRKTLYRALGHAYEFALAAEAEPEDLAEMLDDAGIKRQARAPMTAIAKLVFGAGYDKARLTEFAAALGYGRRHSVASGDFTAFLGGFAGGLKAIVAAERRERRPQATSARSTQARDQFRSKPARALVEVSAPGSAEFVLLVARREADGRLAILDSTDHEPFVDQALRRISKRSAN
jgi:hypothetical protein